MKPISKHVRRFAGCFVLCLSLLLSAATAMAAAAPTIKLNRESVTLYTSEDGSTVQLKATVTGGSKKVSWKSSNKKVAEVNAKGKVTAKKTGETVITAKANGVSAKCTVTVKNLSSKEKKIIEAYKKLVRKNWEKSGVYLGCYDIDQDGIVEVAIMGSVNPDGSFDIYDYVNDKFVRIGVGGYSQLGVIPARKFLISMCGDVIQVYSLANGKMKMFHEYVYPGSVPEDSAEWKEWMSGVELGNSATPIQTKLCKSEKKAVSLFLKKMR